MVLLLLRKVIVILSLFAAFSQEPVQAQPSDQTTDDICNNGVPASVPCFNVLNKWEIFRLSLNMAMEGQIIKYCPFLITDVGLTALPTTKAAYVCAVPGACVIRGPGRHILIQEPTAETVFYGFVFQNATDTSFRVAANASKTQMLCRTFFERNSALHGGAIRTDPNTDVTVRFCHFHSNFARVAGAISNHGHMHIVKSTFSENQAMGGAIALNGSASLTIALSSFFMNQANQGPDIYNNGPDNEIKNVFTDSGSNKAFGSTCGGLYNIGNTTQCIEFSDKTIGPTIAPSIGPSDSPSISPSLSPSSVPTGSSKPSVTHYPSSLTGAPSPSPSEAPSIATSDPTSGPTQSPTPSPPTAFPSSNPTVQATYVPPLDPGSNFLPLVSRNQPQGYYNFNLADPDFGPNAWGNVDVSNNPYSMYADLNWDTSVNECGVGGFGTPIDLYITTTRCQEIHQIRAHNGNWKNMTAADEVTFEVTPTRLRIQLSGNGSGHPLVDPAHGIDPIYASHIEVTLPSLHTFNGRRYDAEYSIFSVYSKLQEVVIASVVIDASENIFNLQFQKMLNAWAEVTTCGLGKGRRLMDMMDPKDAKDEDPYRFNRVLDEDEERRLSETARIDGQFNIFDLALFPSIYLFGYRGSLPVPPCTRTAEWRVLDVPMSISWSQLERLKRILKRGPCENSPYRDGFNQVLSRPLQPAGLYDAVWHCTAANYLSDCQRSGKLCPAPGYNGPPGTP